MNTTNDSPLKIMEPWIREMETQMLKDKVKRLEEELDGYKNPIPFSEYKKVLKIRFIEIVRGKQLKLMKSLLTLQPVSKKQLEKQTGSKSLRRLVCDTNKKILQKNIFITSKTVYGNSGYYQLIPLPEVEEKL